MELTIDVRSGNKRTAALLFNQISVGAQLLNSATHRDAAHLVLLGKLKLGWNALLRCIDTLFDRIFDFIVNLLVKRCIFRRRHIWSLLSKYRNSEYVYNVCTYDTPMIKRYTEPTKKGQLFGAFILTQKRGRQPPRPKAQTPSE